MASTSACRLPTLSSTSTGTCTDSSTSTIRWVWWNGSPPVSLSSNVQREERCPMRAVTKRRLVPLEGVVAGLLILVAAGCGTSGSAPAVASLSPSPTATADAFVSAFFTGHAAKAATLTTEGHRALGTLVRDQDNLRMLLVNAPPFTPISALHWTTHCSGLACSVTFGSFNTHQVPALHLHLQPVGHHARIAMKDLSGWLAALGHIH
jgi:hypothetical protein